MSSVPRDPIVLVHGILGFDSAFFGMVEYFRGVRKALLEVGCVVPEPPKLTAAGLSKKRAEELGSYLQTHAAVETPVHLIAHSMGGLDARVLISMPGMADRVRSLTTIGTPHKGTPLADIDPALRDSIVKRFGDRGLDIKGCADLTTAKASALEDAAGNKKGVSYFSIAGQNEPGWLDLLRPSHHLIRDAGGGPNDGLVPVSSAMRDEPLGIWPANHFRLINWTSSILVPPHKLFGREILERYVGITRMLADRGF